MKHLQGITNETISTNAYKVQIKKASHIKLYRRSAIYIGLPFFEINAIITLSLRFRLPLLYKICILYNCVCFHSALVPAPRWGRSSVARSPRRPTWRSEVSQERDYRAAFHRALLAGGLGAVKTSARAVGGLVCNGCLLDFRNFSFPKSYPILSQLQTAVKTNPEK